MGKEYLMAIVWRQNLNRWSVLVVFLLILAAVPFYLLLLTLGWTWRALVASAVKLTSRYEKERPGISP